MRMRISTGLAVHTGQTGVALCGGAAENRKKMQKAANLGNTTQLKLTPINIKDRKKTTIRVKKETRNALCAVKRAMELMSALRTPT